MDLTPPTLDDVRAARERIEGHALRTPLVRFERGPRHRHADGVPAGEEPEIWLKLESLQPIGSFKLRGALNRIRSLPRQRLANGVYTASAGNMAQGVAYAARLLGVPAAAVVPDSAPEAKRAAIERLGARVVPVPYDEWWATMQEHHRQGLTGTFVHPFADRDVLAGNGTIALEIIEHLGEVDALFVPWGGGGLACGIAATARALRPHVRVYACEVEGSAPLHASLAADRPVAIANARSFVDGIGGPSVFPEMWDMTRTLIAGSLVVPVADVADAVRLIALRCRAVAEGAGAAALAAALAHATSLVPRPQRVACIVSGGNIDAAKLATILSGSIP